MSLLFADNFSHYGTSTARMLEGIYAQVSGSLVLDPDGVSSGRVFRTGAQGARKALPSTNNKTGAAVRIWLDALPTVSDVFLPGITLRNSSDTSIIGVLVTPTGALQVVNFLSSALNIWSTIAGITTGPVMSAKGWYHIEIEYTASDKTCKVYVENREVLSVVTASTTSGAVAQVYIGGNWGGGGGDATLAHFKDYAIWNGAGTRNNSPLGTVQAVSLDLNGDIAQPWIPTPSDKAGYEILRNNPPNNAQFLTAPFPVPDPYIGTLTALPEDVTSVKGIVTYARLAKTDGGDANVQISLISDGEEASGANHTGSVAQTYWLDVFEVDPSTSMPWTPTSVDTVNLKIDRTL